MFIYLKLLLPIDDLNVETFAYISQLCLKIYTNINGCNTYMSMIYVYLMRENASTYIFSFNFF